MMRNAANYDAEFIHFTKIQFSDRDRGGHSKRVRLHQVSLKLKTKEIIPMTGNVAIFCQTKNSKGFLIIFDFKDVKVLQRADPV